MHSAHPDHPFTPQARAMARRLNAVLLAGASLPWIAGWIAACATAMLLLKLLVPHSAALVEGCVWATAAALLIPFITYSILHRRGRFYTEPQVIEWIDHWQGGDGSVSAAYERPALLRDAEALTQIQRRLAARRPHLDGGFFVRRTAPALLYFAAALLVPARPVAALQPVSTSVGETLTAPLLERLAEQEEYLPEAEARALREAVEQIRDNPAGVSREQWEAIEELEQRINDAGERTAAGAAQMAGTLDQLADSLGAAGNIEGTSATQQAGAGKLNQELLRQLEQQANDPRNALSEAMKKQARQLAKQMGRPGADGEALRKQLEELRKKMNDGKNKGECDGNCSGKGNCDGSCKGDKPGNGGITRGRADAELTFGEEQLAPNAAFKDQELQNQFLAPEDLVDMGITPLAPQAPTEAAPAAPAPRGYDAAIGARASRTRIAPSQREMIARYFAQEDQQP